MEIAMTAIGIANPPYKQSQQETAERVSAGLHLNPAEKRLLKSIYKATGIEYRHSVLSDYCKSLGEFEFFPNEADALFPTTSARMEIFKNNALLLALAAIENCFSTLVDFNKNEITHLITVSCTGMYAPGLDIEIVQELKLKTSTQRTAINFMGCYGAFNAIKVANAICTGDSNAKVLVVCVELCTLHFQKSSSRESMIPNAIFADGAAAVLIEVNPARKKYFNLTTFHCDLLPQTNKEMAWKVADFGFDIVLSSYVPDIIQNGIAGFTKQLLNQYGLTNSQVDFYAIHPGGLKILQACEEALNLTSEDNKYAYQILRHYGNMSSATILFVLKAIWDDLTHLDHAKNILSCAFGPGLTLESMLLKSHVMQ